MGEPEFKPSFAESKIQHLFTFFSTSPKAPISPHGSPLNPANLLLSVSSPSILDYSLNLVDQVLAHQEQYMSEIHQHQCCSFLVQQQDFFFMYTIEMKHLNDSLFKYHNVKYAFSVQTLFSILLAFRVFIFVFIPSRLPKSRHFYR